ncbi:uncharacterized protein BDZ99DRAFT_469231 [Mytilinidion resinicola]|uniref:DUF7730 domain-containing protein n=1 Tax=Mytilinidion resinicola TaxID=574789 RepID=A0A6A6Y085_9PEZI|nr:uncharacterized protein BDZ99DRAFT_469231 [Mytilinidion resinicola]KAF2801933.1 hypothetical protein BDZ99DRAFT_469231 [Mytilinidion resinicola]
MSGFGEAQGSHESTDDLPDDGSARFKKRRLSASNIPDKRKKLSETAWAKLHSNTHNGTAIGEQLDEPSTTALPTAVPTIHKPGLTLLDLPTELRLEIYDYLLDDLLMHIYHDPTVKSRLCCSSSACAQTDESSLLCKFPNWTIADGCCNYETPREDCKNPLVFAFTSKKIYQETSLLLYSRPTFHISHVILMPFLYSLKDDQRSAIQSLIVTGPFMGGRRAVTNAGDALEKACDLLPGLRRIGVQMPISNGLMAGNSLDPRPRWHMWKFSQVLLASRKEGVQQVVLETTSLYKGGDTRLVVFKAKQEAKEWLLNRDMDNINTTTNTSTLSGNSYMQCLMNLFGVKPPLGLRDFDMLVENLCHS